MIKFSALNSNARSRQDHVLVGTRHFDPNDLDISTRTAADIRPLAFKNHRPNTPVNDLFKAEVIKCEAAVTGFLAELKSASLNNARFGPQCTINFNIELVNKNDAKVNAAIKMGYSVNPRTNQYSLDHEHIQMKIPSGKFAGDYAVTKDELPKTVLEAIKTYMSSSANPLNVKLENGDPADARASNGLKAAFANAI